MILLLYSFSKERLDIPRAQGFFGSLPLPDSELIGYKGGGG